MMMATSTDDCVNHNPNFLIDVNFDNDDDGLFGFNDGGRDDDMAIDVESFFTILDEDLPPGDQSLLEFSGNSFYPSMDQTQESASAAHIGNNDDLHFRFDNGAATESSADTGEAPEQVCFASAPDVSFFNSNGASFAKSNIEPGLRHPPKIMKTECYPSTQDCSSTYDISSGFPNQNPIDGMNYGMILTNEAAKGNLEDSHLWIDNKTTLESQVGVATMSASEIPMHDFCDSFLHDNYTFSQVDTGNTFDSSSTTTDETSADPFCRGTKSESNGEPASLHGYQGTSRRASKEDAFGRHSFGFDIKDFAASSKAPFSGGQIGRPDDYQRGFASERKPTKPPMINSLISCSRFGALRYKKEEEAVTQAANIKQDTFYGSNEVYGSSLSDNRAYSEADDDDDDDDDICIIEDLSVPARVSSQAHPVSVHKKSVTSHMSTFFPGHIPPAPSYSQVGVTVNRVKVADERLIFQAAVQDLSQPKTEANPPEGVLAVPLLRHQRIALSWMVQKETTSLQCSGGILADDQGLGKTVSTIALILTERASCARTTTQSAQKELETLDLDEEDDKLMKNGASQKDIQSTPIKSRPSGGTLVVCPTSVLRQWGDELKNKVADKVKLSVCMYHGSNRTKDPYELASYDVVLTTYSIVSMEVPKSVAAKEMNDKKKLDADDRAAALGKKRKHSSKSEERRLKKEMEEGLLESSARPLARVNWFRVVLDEAQSIKNYKTQVAQACWGLRAKRRWCLSGTPIQNTVDDLYSYFRFLRYDPYSVYKSFCSMVKFPITKNPSNGYKKLQAVLKTIMLRRTKGTLLDGEPIINLPPKVVKLKKVEFSEEERDFYTRLEADSRAQFQAYAASGTVKQNYVNILLMLLRLRQSCDHPFLVQGSGSGSGSALKSSIHAARKLPREQQINLLNCLEASLAICGICSDPPEDASISTCGHVFCNQCISERLTGDENQCPVKNCKTQLNISSVFSKAALKSCIEGSSEQAEGVKPSLASCFTSSKIRTALKLLQSLSKPRPPVPDDNSMESSVSDVGCSNKPSSTPSTSKSGLIEKAIVFSQWTSMLDLLEDGLKQCSLNYRRLDGTMSVTARDKAVKDFNTLPEVSVMIMSLKAASLGLNMVAACHVILLDLWWNPTTEDQAIDRAHRIGQTRPVTVVRLTVKDTVEDRILALQQKKRELVASAFGEDETGSRQTRLTVEDLNYLFMA